MQLSVLHRTIYKTAYFSNIVVHLYEVGDEQFGFLVSLVLHQQLKIVAYEGEGIIKSVEVGTFATLPHHLILHAGKYLKCALYVAQGCQTMCHGCLCAQLIHLIFIAACCLHGLLRILQALCVPTVLPCKV